ncbi:hypothetical protein QOZ80_1AG0017300 [Eleusine coracana subsp. coracana]|nr:hypothetical protein QOZ80_1AG0017300 [Eleusine coracana subsp. coracana]
MESMEHATQNLASNVGQLLAAEYRQLRGVGREIAELRDDLATMNALLRMQSEAEDGAVFHFVQEWMKQLRELAYDSEDCIDLYLLRIKCRPGEGVRARLGRLLETFFPRRSLAGQISELRARAVAISERHARYGVNAPPPPPPPSLLPAPQMLTASAPKHAALSRANEPGHNLVIRIVEQVDALANQLKASVQGDQYLKVFSVVGFGGVGKTTLAMEVCQRLEPEFPCQAFVSVSQAFDPSSDLKALLKRVLEQIVKPKTENEKGIKEEESLRDIDSLDADLLAKKLEDKVKDMRYLIVMDDLWTIRAWESIHSVLPENNCNSRIIVTTRIEAVAKACSLASSVKGHFIHHMEPFKLEDSKRLFLSRAFGSLDASYPTELKDVMDTILKKCGGLPLAIVSIASVLAGYKSSGSIDKWETICKSIVSQMESNPTLEGIRQIVTISFNHLPHELKGCMMYLSIFPEDYAINKDRLMCRWIAEGLVSEKRGLTQIEVAESYLDELLSRNMIKANRLDEHKRDHSYQVHNLLLEIMVSKSLEANFISLKGGQYDGMSYDRIRRLSMHDSAEGTYSSSKIKVAVHRGAEEMNVKHVRSLSMFQLQGHKLLDQLGNFTLLRVLDLEGCEGVTNRHVRYACQLHLLRFLSLKSTNIIVGNLEHLQTLAVRTTLLDYLPETVTKLERIERRKFSKRRWDIKWMLPRGLSKMKAFRDVGLVRLRNDAEVAREVGELELLQTLDLHIGHETIGEEVLRQLALSLSKRYSLRCLSIVDISAGKILNFLHHISTPPRLLRSLGISGGINGLPGWVGSFTYLVDFAMMGTDLVGDELLGALCELPNLKTLYASWKSYREDELVARMKHKFPVLRDLRFGGALPKVIRFEEGCMENLETLELRIRSRELETSIIGIERLTNLKMITLKGDKDSPALYHGLSQG